MTHDQRLGLFRFQRWNVDFEVSQNLIKRFDGHIQIGKNFTIAEKDNGNMDTFILRLLLEKPDITPEWLAVIKKLSISKFNQLFYQIGTTFRPQIMNFK